MYKLLVPVHAHTDTYSPRRVTAQHWLWLGERAHVKMQKPLTWVQRSQGLGLNEPTPKVGPHFPSLLAPAKAQRQSVDALPWEDTNRTCSLCSSPHWAPQGGSESAPPQHPSPAQCGLGLGLGGCSMSP